MKTAQIETYSFWWSEVRLVIAAIALFIGGVPPIYLVVPSSVFGITVLLLKICWVVSGLTAGYLLYRWYEEGQKLFGHKDHYDTIAFLVLAVSGLNLGFAGIFGRNLGMSISTNHVVLIVVAICYLLAAWQLWSHSKKHAGKIF